MDKENMPVPVEPGTDPSSQVEADYQQAKSYFKDSTLQMLRTNMALLTVLGLFVVRGVRYAWEALQRYLPWNR